MGITTKFHSPYSIRSQRPSTFHGVYTYKLINRMPGLFLSLSPSFSKRHTPLDLLTSEMNKKPLLQRIWELLNSHSLCDASFQRRIFGKIIATAVIPRRIWTLRIFAALDSGLRALPVDVFIELQVVFCTSVDSGIGVKQVVPLSYGSTWVSWDRPVATAAAIIFAAEAKFARYFRAKVVVELWHCEEGAADYTQGEFS